MDDVSASIGKLTEGWCHGLNANQVQSFILVPQSLTGLVHKHNGWCHLFHLALAQLCHGHCQREWWAVLIATLLEMMLSDKRKNGGGGGRGETERSKTRATLAEEAAASRLFFWPVPVGFESKTPTSAGTGGQSSMFKHHPRESREISSLWITDRHSLLLMSAPIPEREQCARLVWETMRQCHS